ncbi:MAG TPA: flagellar basal body-associated FliL family protein, partial [Bacillota bacterium]|nr:flagellar basal body-associated FliL family protein [Bacillota bacterium]
MEQDKKQNKKQNKKKLLAIIIFTILVTLAVSFVIYAYVTQSYIFAEKVRDITNYTYTLDEMVINLNNQGRYLKTTIALGYSLEGDLDILLSKEVQIRDTVISILRSKTVEDIMAVENTDPLKVEMEEKINECFDEKIVTDVYII